jgi:ABC-type sugar transport system permease subunit
MKSRAYPFYFAGGALALYLLFYVLPSLMGFYYAFTDWNSYTTEVNFVGLENFRRSLPPAAVRTICTSSATRSSLLSPRFCSRRPSPWDWRCC